MAKRKKKHGEEEGGEAWLLPYSDLMTLLLAVFIVLFAVSKVDQHKADNIAEVFRENMMTGNESILSGDGNSILEHRKSGDQTDANKGGTGGGESEVSREELEEYLGTSELEYLEELQSKLAIIFEKEDMAASLKIDMRGLIISLDNAVLFESGSAEILKDHKESLEKMAAILRYLPNYIRIEGHTDNIPISTPIYPSNWELSAARASSVVRLFIDEGYVSPDKVVAVGYGEYKPVADNSTVEGRAKNRRIDIIILSEKYNNLEE